MTNNSIRDINGDTVSIQTYLLTSCVLCLVTLVAYWNVLCSDFISFDDPLYIFDRIQVSQGLTLETARWALTSTSDGNWIPVTWLSYLLDVSLFGVNARAHHAVNLFFHIVTTLLLLEALRRMTGHFWRSVVVAALFALHPLHVESVAWIAERKDVLSALYFMITLLGYQSYTKSQTIGRYFVVVLCFALGICSKSMLVTMPFLLLLLDYWPLKRGGGHVSISRIVAEKIPLLCLALVSGVITLNVQRQAGAVVEHVSSPLMKNVANALVSYSAYIYKSIVPVKLAVIYPFNDDILVEQAIVAVFILTVITWLVIRFGSMFPYLPIGWFWFAGMLLPVIGLIRVGTQAMADRYTYLPLTGLFIIAVWGVADFAAIHKVEKPILAGVATLAIAIFSAVTWLQVSYWQDSITLFSHAAEVTENNWLAYEHLGSAFNKRGDVNQAFKYTSESIRIYPKNPVAHTNLGIIYNNMRNDSEAINCFRTALSINPLYDAAHYNLGKTLLFNGDVQGAAAEYKVLLDINPERADALLKTGFKAGGVSQFID